MSIIPVVDFNPIHVERLRVPTTQERYLSLKRRLKEMRQIHGVYPAADMNS